MSQLIIMLIYINDWPQSSCVTMKSHPIMDDNLVETAS